MVEAGGCLPVCVCVCDGVATCPGCFPPLDQSGLGQAPPTAPVLRLFTCCYGGMDRNFPISWTVNADRSETTLVHVESDTLWTGFQLLMDAGCHKPPSGSDLVDAHLCINRLHYLFGSGNDKSPKRLRVGIQRPSCILSALAGLKLRSLPRLPRMIASAKSLKCSNVGPNGSASLAEI